MAYTLPTQAELAQARQHLRDKSRQALGDSYRASHPNATDAEVKAFMWGRDPEPAPDSLEASIRKSHPDWSDRQVEIFVRGQ